MREMINTAMSGEETLKFSKPRYTFRRVFIVYLQYGLGLVVRTVFKIFIVVIIAESLISLSRRSSYIFNAMPTNNLYLMFYRVPIIRRKTGGGG
jgi:hypothetical protein